MFLWYSYKIAQGDAAISVTLLSSFKTLWWVEATFVEFIFNTNVCINNF